MQDMICAAMNPKMSLNSQQYKVLKKIYILLYDKLSY